MGERHFITVENGDIELRVAVQGAGPLILCIHGWPEIWYSWRHQMSYFAERGYTVAAMDVRGYGGSSKPHEISAYTMRELAGDAAAVIDHLAAQTAAAQTAAAQTAAAQPAAAQGAIVLGHDWGAPIAWNTARLHPEKVRAVCGLSVPYLPISTHNPFDHWRALYDDNDKFFYQTYFEEEGVAETEMETDSLRAIRLIYFDASGEFQSGPPRADKPADATLLDGLVDPDPFPAWCSDEDLKVYADAMHAGGWRGPFNRYRAQPLDADDIGHLPNPNITQPAAFIGSEHDVVRTFVPGLDAYDFASVACDDFRGTTVIPGAGHWVQQERPEETNAALQAFFSSL